MAPNSRRFAGQPASVAQARRFVRAELAAVDEAVIEDAVTLVSELASNSVMHAESGFTVSVECLPGEILIEVADEGGGTPKRRSPRPTEPSGRGLLIVGQLSSSWGVRRPTRSRGKSVWFRLRVGDRAAAGPSA